MNKDDKIGDFVDGLWAYMETVCETCKHRKLSIDINYEYIVLDYTESCDKWVEGEQMYKEECDKYEAEK